MTYAMRLPPFIPRTRRDWLRLFDVVEAGVADEKTVCCQRGIPEWLWRIQRERMSR